MPAVVHSQERSEFTLSVPGHESAYLRYTSSPSAITMYTTVVPASLEGRGVAKLLADAAFEHAVERQAGVVLSCWYLSGYLRRHPREDVARLLIQE
jgi:predicted GNAT family acetyltransferase